MSSVKSGLELLRSEFPENQISKLPKPTKRQTALVKENWNNGARCTICGQWHHPDVVHLDYVGHAALTARLLDCDPEWNWAPQARLENGAPALDGNGGLWIDLTVCGLTRPGYGHADGKKGGDAVKEAIGDALRNAAMRFGAALDLWHKGELYVDDDPDGQDEPNIKDVGQQMADDLKEISEKGDLQQLEALTGSASWQQAMTRLRIEWEQGFNRIGELITKTREAVNNRDSFPAAVND